MISSGSMDLKIGSSLGSMDRSGPVQRSIEAARHDDVSSARVAIALLNIIVMSCFGRGDKDGVETMQSYAGKAR